MAFRFDGQCSICPQQERVLRASLEADNLDKALEEVAKGKRVSPNRLANWRNKPAFVAAYRDLVLQAVQDSIPDVIRILLLEARKGSIQHIRLLLDMVGLRKGPRRESPPADVPIEFESEVLKRLMKRLEGGEV